MSSAEHEAIVAKRKEAWKKRGRPGAKRRDITDTAAKVGMSDERIGAVRKQAIENHFARKQLLVVPKEILAAHPDKHFFFVNFNKLQKQGMWHPKGYRLFKNEVDSGAQTNEKFNEATDRYLHRNEMALAWIPKEEFARRQAEFQLVRGTRDPGQIIQDNPGLANFEPFIDLQQERSTNS